MNASDNYNMQIHKNKQQNWFNWFNISQSLQCATARKCLMCWLMKSRHVLKLYQTYHFLFQTVQQAISWNEKSPDSPAAS